MSRTANFIFHGDLFEVPAAKVRVNFSEHTLDGWLERNTLQTLSPDEACLRGFKSNFATGDETTTGSIGSVAKFELVRVVSVAQI